MFHCVSDGTTFLPDYLLFGYVWKFTIEQTETFVIFAAYFLEILAEDFFEGDISVLGHILIKTQQNQANEKSTY
jgi:hypothetical protein